MDSLLSVGSSRWGGVCVGGSWTLSYPRMGGKNLAAPNPPPGQHTRHLMCLPGKGLGLFVSLSLRPLHPLCPDPETSKESPGTIQ